MIPSVRFSRACDFIGTAALVSAVVVLGSRSFISNVAETTIFSGFFVCLAVAVGAYLVARVAQITQVIANNPNPRSRRVAQVTASNLATVAQTPASVESTANDLQRAA